MSDVLPIVPFYMVNKPIKYHRNVPKHQKRKKPDLQKYDPPMRMRFKKSDEKRGEIFLGKKWEEKKN